MQSMDEIYQKYARYVYKYLFSMTRDDALAEELTQETFYHAIQNIHRFDGSCQITTWLCAIARNQLRVYQRKHPVMESLDDTEFMQNTYNQREAVWRTAKQEGRLSAADMQTIRRDGPMSPVETEVISKAARMDILKKLHCCQEPYREVLYLRLFGDLSFKEIGDILGKTENWARVTFYRGKEKLRKELKVDD